MRQAMRQGMRQGRGLVHHPGNATEVADEDVVCEVCRDGGWDELNKIVFCDDCSVAVHQYCYGVSKIPEGDIPWFCDLCHFKRACKTLLTTMSPEMRQAWLNPKCLLCHNDGGARKATIPVSADRSVPSSTETLKQTKWLHASCALAVPEVSFKDISTLSYPQGYNTMSVQRRRSLLCEFCSRLDGVVLECSVGTCRRNFHVRCGQDKTCLFELRATSGEKKAFCSSHRNRFFKLFMVNHQASDLMNATKKEVSERMNRKAQRGRRQLRVKRQRSRPFRSDLASVDEEDMMSIGSKESRETRSTWSTKDNRLRKRSGRARPSQPVLIASTDFHAVDLPSPQNGNMESLEANRGFQRKAQPVMDIDISTVWERVNEFCQSLGPGNFLQALAGDHINEGHQNAQQTGINSAVSTRIPSVILSTAVPKLGSRATSKPSCLQAALTFSSDSNVHATILMNPRLQPFYDPRVDVMFRFEFRSQTLSRLSTRTKDSSHALEHQRRAKMTPEDTKLLKFIGMTQSSDSEGPDKSTEVSREVWATYQLLEKAQSKTRQQIHRLKAIVKGQFPTVEALHRRLNVLLDPRSPDTQACEAVKNIVHRANQLESRALNHSSAFGAEPLSQLADSHQLQQIQQETSRILGHLLGLGAYPDEQVQDRIKQLTSGVFKIDTESVARSTSGKLKVFVRSEEKRLGLHKDIASGYARGTAPVNLLEKPSTAQILKQFDFTRRQYSREALASVREKRKFDGFDDMSQNSSVAKASHKGWKHQRNWKLFQSYLLTWSTVTQST